MNRRLFLFGTASLLSAPSIVRAASLMPVRVDRVPPFVRRFGIPASYSVGDEVWFFDGRAEWKRHTVIATMTGGVDIRAR